MPLPVNTLGLRLLRNTERLLVNKEKHSLVTRIKRFFLLKETWHDQCNS
jgi:hypothetical protein